MMIWVVFSVLTVVAALSVLVPLWRARGETSTSSSAHDVEVYKAQLGEVERDLDRGLITGEAAEAARTEIARRLIAADEAVRRDEPDDKAGRRAFELRTAQVIGAICVPLAAIGFYLVLGSPNEPDQPLQARLNAAPAEDRSLPEMVAMVERRLAENPSDGRGWDVIAPVYMRMGRPDDAAAAYAAAIRLLGSTAQREADFGEALVFANDGVIDAQAHAAFERAVAIDAAAVKPRFYLATALGQENRREEAISAWQALLQDARGGEAWVPVVRQRLADLGVDTPPDTSAPGPSEADVAAASALSEEDRTAMILSMVDGLDQRLADEGGSVEEWIRLMRAVAVLGDADRLRDVAGRAVSAFENDPAAAEQVESLARELGVGS